MPERPHRTGAPDQETPSGHTLWRSPWLKSCRRRRMPGRKGWIGSMKDTMDIVGDIVSPVIDEKGIEALRD